MPVAKGGTGSATQNWVDLTTVQNSISGTKTWTARGTFTGGITSTGADVNLNASSNSNTNINTGNSTGTIEIGNNASGGLRIGTSKVTRNYPTEPTTGGNTTLTASQVFDAGIYVLNSNGNVTFPTATSLVAAMPSPKVGDVINFVIATTGNFDATVAVGSGGTIGSQSTSPNRTTRYLFIRITNVSSGSEAYTIY